MTCCNAPFIYHLGIIHIIPINVLSCHSIGQWMKQERFGNTRPAYTPRRSLFCSLIPGMNDQGLSPHWQDEFSYSGKYWLSPLRRVASHPSRRKLRRWRMKDGGRVRGPVLQGEVPFSPSKRWFCFVVLFKGRTFRQRELLMSCQNYSEINHSFSLRTY